MSEDHWQRVKHALGAALEHPIEGREAFLRAACGDDEDLRREVESLLAARTEAGHFLSEPARLEEEALSSARLAPGTRLGPYEIVSFLGAGGMGEVYKARDTRLERTVAIKLLRGEAAHPDRHRRFEREARTISQLSHPHICALYDVGQHEGASFLVMEYLEGGTLAQRLEAGPMPLEESLPCAIQIAEALAEAHQHGIVHRDLKPANVVLTKKGAKLLDFGIAKVRAAAPAEMDSTRSRTLTREGLVIGTLEYMAPEQLEGAEADERTDVFAFGLVVYEMVSGRRAFAATSAPALIAAILKCDPPPLSRLQPPTPPSVETVVQRCLAKDPTARFSSASELLSALRRPEDGVVQAPRASLRRVVALRHRRASAALAVGAMGAVVWAALATRPFASRPAIDSLAVLPFVNGTGDADAEYLSDGLAESVINTLSAVPDLRLAARSSAFRYKGREASPQKVCQELDVGGLLTGRVVRHGADVIVQVDLVEGQRGSQLWGQRYARPLTDLLVLQAEIAQDVAAHLRVRLGHIGEQRLASRLTTDPEAYRLYLLGRFHSNQRTRDGMVKALDHYKRAAERDPTFGLAWAGQAEAQLHLMIRWGTGGREGYPAAKAAALKALELAPDRAEAHAPLGHLAMAFEADWDGAEREFRRALDLDPTYDLARQWYAYFLVALGRADEAVAQIRQAKALDPASYVTTLDACVIDFYARRFDEGITQCQRALEMNPNEAMALILRGRMYLEKGLLEQAEADLRASHAMPGIRPGPNMVSYYLRVGREAEARKILRAELARKPPTRAASLAILYAAFGEADEAFVWLERAYADRDPILMLLNANVVWDPIRADPRFRELTRRIGLPTPPSPP